MGGRPEWAGRSAVTLKIYERKGIKYSGVLQASGSLRARVVTSHTQDEAVISNNMPYAAAMHFGSNKVLQVKLLAVHRFRLVIFQLVHICQWMLMAICNLKLSVKFF
jgi:phage gpG-like protein